VDDVGTFCFRPVRVSPIPILAAAALFGSLAAPIAAADAVISNGAYRMGADVFWSRGIVGTGSTVAILDMGFGGLEKSIAAGELPAQGMVLRSFDDEYGLDGRTPVGSQTQHGTRMAEIVHDVAPGAQLLLVNYHTQDEFQDAVDWVIARAPAVISHSNSFLTPPYDGTGPSAAAVNRAAAAGILWVNSAGNFAKRHWTGRASAAGTIFPLEVAPGQVLSYSITPFGTSSDRVHAELQKRGASGVWAEQTSVSAGPDGALTDTLVSDGGEWRLQLTQTVGSDSLVRIFSRTIGFGGLAAGDGSIPTPGDAAGSLTVGAVPWTGTDLAPYSSRGPTQDGRPKPDVVGPTYVTANREWPGTAGTSAATAHVAGAAALIADEQRAVGGPTDLATLRGRLTGAAFDLGDPGIDPSYGAGMVRLDATPPKVTLAVNDDARPQLVGLVRDQGTIGEVVVSIDGRRVRSLRSAQIRMRLPRMKAGRHRVVVAASDTSGNRVTAGQWVRVER